MSKRLTKKEKDCMTWSVFKQLIPNWKGIMMVFNTPKGRVVVQGSVLWKAIRKSIPNA